MLSVAGCATVENPQRVGVPIHQRGEIDVFGFINDVFWTAGLGLIVDFYYGTIYVPKPGYRGPGSWPSALKEHDDSPGMNCGCLACHQR